MATTIATPTPTATTTSQANIQPSAKDQRYDRQLRLWAASGQSALENASVLAVYATSTSASSLKNLVLPGVGNITLLDPNLATEADIGNNFFLERGSLGKNKAEEIGRLVCELNEGVKWEADLRSPESIDATLIRRHNLVILIDEEKHSTTLKIAKLCWELEVPLIVIKTFGFFAEVRVQIGEACFVETHPDSYEDLRLDSPWPELIEYSKSFANEGGMDGMEHSHIPFVVIMVNELERWKAEHDGKLPSDFGERKQLKENLLKRKRNNDEDNFDEAVHSIFKACQPSKVPEEIETLFKDPACENLSNKSSPFWIMLRAVREFVQQTGFLPVHGSLPDMKSDTKGYITLQGVYKDKAGKDLAQVEGILRGLLKGLEIDDGLIEKDALDTFVKHSRFLKVLRGKSLMDEEKGSLDNSRLDDPSDPYTIYAALRAVDSFNLETGRFPEDSDFSAVQDHFRKLRNGESEIPQATDDAIKESCRCAHADLPQIAALVGGVVAQEGIKLITRQYIPIKDTWIFDGVRSGSGVIEH